LGILERRARAAFLVSGLVVACNGGPGSRSVSTPAELILTPATLTLVKGGSGQFTVNRVESDGKRTSPAVSYHATGGSITGAGLFTAGQAAGTFRIIATLKGGSLADTAMILITPGRAYTTTFPLTENPISEDGRWINGGSVGLDWTNVSTAPGLAIGHQVGANYTDATALLSGIWGPDQRVSATVYSVGQNDACYQEVELRLRSTLRAHLATGYEIMFRASQTTGANVVIARRMHRH